MQFPNTRSIDKGLTAVLGGSERFRKNFVKLASASLAAQALGLLSLPLLTRLFSAENFGALTTYTSLQAVFLAVCTLRADWLVPNSKSDAQARRLLYIGLFCVLLMAVAGLTGLALLGDQIEFGDSALNLTLLFILPVALPFAATQILMQAWYVYRGGLGVVSLAKLLQAVTTFGLSVALGLLAFGASGLIIGYVAGFVTAAFVLVRSDTEALRPMPQPRLIVKALRLYAGRLSSAVGLSLTNAVMLSSIVLLLLVFFDATILGWYGLVFRLATAPISLITTGLVQSFWADAAHLSKTDPAALRRFYLASCARLMVVAVPMTAVFALGPLYIPIIFGAEEWSGAGWVLTAVTPYLFGMMVFSPTTHLIVYDKTHWQFVSDLGTLIASIVAFAWIATSGGGHLAAIFASSCVMLLGYCVRFVLHLIANSQAQNRIKANSQPPRPS